MLRIQRNYPANLDALVELMVKAAELSNREYYATVLEQELLPLSGIDV